MRTKSVRSAVVNSSAVSVFLAKKMKIKRAVDSSQKFYYHKKKSHLKTQQESRCNRDKAAICS